MAEIMLYEIINPSDPYTFEAESYAVASLAVLVLGNGQLGVERIDGTEMSTSTPFVAFSSQPDEDADAWARSVFGGKSLSEALDANMRAVGTALSSVLIGRKTDRVLYDAAVANMNETQKDDYTRLWHDRKRNSMNDIGARARKIAETIMVKVNNGR